MTDYACPNDPSHETVVKEDGDAYLLFCYDCDETVDWDSKIPEGANGPGTFQWQANKRRGA